MNICFLFLTIPAPPSPRTNLLKVPKENKKENDENRQREIKKREKKYVRKWLKNANSCQIIESSLLCDSLRRC